MKKIPTIYLMHGFIGCGKTTVAKQIQKEIGAILLTHDDFMIKEYGRNPEDFSKARFDIIDEKIKSIAKEEIAKGNSVIMDYGFWEKETRKKYFKWAKNLTSDVQFLAVQCDIEIAKQRALKRTEDDLTQFVINEEIFSDRLKRFEPMTKEESQKEEYQTKFFKT